MDITNTSHVAIYTSSSSYKDILDRIQYKDNVSFRWKGGAANSKFLEIAFSVPNSYHPENKIVVEHRFACPWEHEFFRVFQTDKEKIDWIFDCLIQAERHEAKEFFKVDGEVFDPPGHGMFEDPYK